LCAHKSFVSIALWPFSLLRNWLRSFTLPCLGLRVSRFDFSPERRRLASFFQPAPPRLACSWPQPFLPCSYCLFQFSILNSEFTILNSFPAYYTTLLVIFQIKSSNCKKSTADFADERGFGFTTKARRTTKKRTIQISVKTSCSFVSFVVKDSLFSPQGMRPNERNRLYGKANQVSCTIPMADRANHPPARGRQNLDHRHSKETNKLAKIELRRVGFGPPINNGGASPSLPAVPRRC